MVGAHNAGAGSVYFYVRHEDQSGQIQWRLQQRVAASDGQAGDAFGYSVALDEDVAIVGAPRDDTNTGSAYIFMRSDGPLWVQKAKLTASDRETSDYFGSSVAIDGATAVVGAYGEDPGGTQNAGAIYVFVRSGDRWNFQAKLIAEDEGWADKFGYSVAVTGNTISVGAYHDDPGYKPRAGSMYTFIRSGGRWVQQRKVIADDRQPDDQFGSAVSIIGENCSGGKCCIPVDGRWSTVPMPDELPCGKIVKATCTNPAPSCGGSPCVGPPPKSYGTKCDSGRECDIVTNQCKQDVCCGPNCILGITHCVVIRGVRYCPRCVFRPEEWISPQCQGASEIRCGAKIPNTDGICVMGQTCDCKGIYCRSERPVRKCSGVGTNCPSGSRTVVSGVRNDGFTGSVYIVSNGKQKRVVVGDGGPQDRFGSAVAISEYDLVVGARDEDVGGIVDAGAVYVFGTSGGQRLKLSAQDKQQYDYLGQAASVYDTLMIVGAYGRDSYGGAAYIFTYLDGLWEQEVQLKE